MIRAIRLRNWGPYRGDHELLLGAKAYGVFARDEKDDERSNGFGKSMIAEAVDFALFGRLNPDRHYGKNDWISEGEPDGYVDVLIGEDVVVHRARKRDKAETLVVTGKELLKTQAEAQLEVGRLVGLTQEDFLTAAYFRQGEMAQLVRMKPGPRMDVVAGWFGLAPLEAGEKHLRARFREEMEESTKLHASATQLEDQVAEAVVSFGHTTVENLTFEYARLEEGIEHDEEELRGTVASCEEAQRQMGLRAAREEFVAVQAEGKELRARFDAINRDELQAEFDAYRARSKELLLAIGPLRKEGETKRLLARGHFEGVCPVASAPCPSSEWVLGEGKKAATHAGRIDTKLEALNREYGLAEHAAKQVEQKLYEHDRIKAKLDVLRGRAKYLKPNHDVALEQGALTEAEVAALFDEMRRLQTAIAEMKATLKRMGVAVDSARAKLDEATKLRARAEAAGKQARARHEAAACFAAARRRIGEASLSEVEAGANAILGECGVDLRVAASWSREGGDPARQCPECGAAMPASAKVKNCATCGADRGLNVINELRLKLSWHSGAAGDLAGLALQLSAGDWLRQRRGSAWSCGLVDEPFGQLDARHRKQVSAHLARVLAGQRGFRQALVVAHQQQVLEALPGRIEIVRRGRWSEVRVVS